MEEVKYQHMYMTHYAQFLVKKYRIFEKPNAQKCSLTNIVYLANLIPDFIVESPLVKKNKSATSRKKSAAIIEATKEITNSTNNMMLHIAEMKIASQEMMVAILATILANK